MGTGHVIVRLSPVLTKVWTDRQASVLFRSSPVLTQVGTDRWASVWSRSDPIRFILKLEHTDRHRSEVGPVRSGSDLSWNGLMVDGLVSL